MNAQSSVTLFLQNNFIVKAARSRVVETVAASVAVSIVLLGSSTWNVWTTYQGFRNSVTTQFKLRSASDRVIHLDEVLTMSARMAASTGDPSWEDRYWTFEPELTAAINQVTRMASENSKVESAKTDQANKILIGMEEQSFALTKAGKKDEAFKLLLGPEYKKNKEIYTQGIEATIADVNASIDQELNAYAQRLLWAVAFTAISCLFLMVGWSFILYVVRLDIRQREKIEADLRVSEFSLQDSNRELEKTQADLAQQAHLVQEENELLEAEVSHLLDIVSNFEVGDFTQQANVSDRVTGLVADMLNQFMSEMSRIIATVNDTCRQLNLSNLGVENMATTTLTMAQEQVVSVEQIQSLMADINTLSQATLSQTIISDESLKAAQGEVQRGEAELNAMTTGFVSLRDGTDQITRRVESLTEFVEMAAQFAQSQKRVATLTRVLAYNASMVANRAEEQQDPAQFANVAREFAAIATQVNDLAVQTNQSLETLDQRTQQIQSAVSGIRDDTQDINQLLTQFTKSVESSSRSFNHLKAVTEQLVQIGQQVNHSSEEIAIAAANTVNSIELIREGGESTETQSRLTQEQSAIMGKLTQELLDRMDFFKISESEPSRLMPSFNAEPSALETVVNTPSNPLDTHDLAMDSPASNQPPELAHSAFS